MTHPTAPPNFAPGAPIFLSATVVEQHADGMTVDVLGERRTVPYSALAGGTGGTPARTTAFAVVSQENSQSAITWRVVIRRGGFGQVEADRFLVESDARELAAKINRVLDVADRVSLSSAGEPEVVVGRSQEPRGRRPMNDDTLHVYAAEHSHCEVYVFGTRGALLALRDAIDRALAANRPEFAVAFAADGEGYAVAVVPATPAEMDAAALPYAVTTFEGGRWPSLSRADWDRLRVALKGEG